MKKNKTYFISDLHLPMNRKPSETLKKILRFLDEIKDNAAELFLVGDVFDFWYEWRFSIPAFQFDFLYKLRSLIENGTEIHYISGNHDFNLGDYLEKEVGLITHLDTHTINIRGKAFFIGHGDGFAPEDKSYRFYKKILRSSISNWLWKTFIHPDLGVKIANMLSNKSRKHHTIRHYWHKVYKQLATEKFNQGFDYFVCGHLHSPLCEKLENGVYINIGDWLENFSYGYFDGENLTLEYFK